ncbi:hypothetical protein NCCP1664_18200 [Zafaria cholistanensis]|uniref:Uncharacterized protein n=1 Tax=Zafaria cholistanensis TaxID=1682741 RepID=A0A5A7NQW4_9MICC|nr:hypothetical protein NCCP1664_18200 [Zafaria cholistanensis]
MEKALAPKARMKSRLQSRAGGRLSPVTWFLDSVPRAGTGHRAHGSHYGLHALPAGTHPFPHAKRRVSWRHCQETRRRSGGRAGKNAAAMQPGPTRWS